MALFPKTLIRCIAEGREPDDREIKEIAQHIWQDMAGDQAPEEFAGEQLWPVACAALRGSPVHQQKETERRREQPRQKHHARGNSTLNVPYPGHPLNISLFRLQRYQQDFPRDIFAK